MPLFDNRHVFKVQILQIIVIHVVLGLSGANLILRSKAGPVTRNTTMSLAIKANESVSNKKGAKSMVFLAYEIGTQHFSKLRRFSSLKTNMILNGLEPLFRGAVAFMGIQGNIQRCNGITCTLGWVIAGCGIFLNLLAAYVAVVSYTDFRFMKRTGTTRGVSVDRNYPRAAEEIASNGSVEQQETASPARKTERAHREQWTR
ncbi:hypothetical protein CH35J_000367 [Colletotrichum higginsianum]|uniref:Uncharacterized protein n=1 Tax=Colletotrichum higginsianum TaxID=80884 RepID=A0A4T0WJU4_9PEZI|nr:hypothetical protein CH35J_000367 [Colletotrichum higginsianum]